MWLSLAACYADPPEVQLHVTRKPPPLMEDGTDAYAGACRPPYQPEQCHCFADGLFRKNRDKVEQDVAIYVPKAKALKLLVGITGTSGTTWHCLPVVLGDDMLELDVDIDTEGVSPWCADGLCGATTGDPYCFEGTFVCRP